MSFITYLLRSHRSRGLLVILCMGVVAAVVITEFILRCSLALDAWKRENSN